MRFDSVRPQSRGYYPRHHALAPVRIAGGGLRIMAKTVAFPLSLIGTLLSLLTFACLVMVCVMVHVGAPAAVVFKPAVAAWLCAGLAYVAFWPRRHL